MSEITNTEELMPCYFNPVRIKLAYMYECLEQLHNGLPPNKEAYINAERLTHSFIKSCFLMIVQRAVDINNIIIEFIGETPPSVKYQGFRLMQENGAIDMKTLNFFEVALLCYRKIANPYEGLPADEFYEIAVLLLKHGAIYTRQIQNFFQDTELVLMPEEVLSENAEAEDLKSQQTDN